MNHCDRCLFLDLSFGLVKTNDKKPGPVRPGFFIVQWVQWSCTYLVEHLFFDPISINRIQPVLQSADFEIRLISTYDEYIEVASLQKEVWGARSIEIVPPSILMVNQKIGGIVAGAFTPENELAAFVYGLPGERNGETIHWSHMLAVRSQWRGQRLGLKLKEYQRQFVIAKGIRVVHWTYDPLESVNANLNLCRLGALPTEYICDLYGKGEESKLHSGIGTDRFILTWFMHEPDREKHLDTYYSASAYVDTPSVISHDLSFTPVQAEVIRIQIPQNIQQLKTVSSDQATSWRNATRAAFLHYFGKGYMVIDYYVETTGPKSFYVMAQAR